MTSDFTQWVELASERVGGKALLASDDFFAPKENLLKISGPIFIPDKYTEFGKWMDGWESRRKRGPGHDWCIVALGLPGIIKGITVNTAHFLGNYPEQCSLDAAEIKEGNDPLSPNVLWQSVVPRSPLSGGTENHFSVMNEKRWSHLRLNIFPDGGIARLRVYGTVKPDWAKLKSSSTLIDLVALENGGEVLKCNDMFFGPKDNLILPGRAKTMGDGWETRRKRGPGNDWIILKLGTPGKIKRVEVDTNHFKGNFPDACSIEICPAGKAEEDLSNIAWETLLPPVKLRAHEQRTFEKELVTTATELAADLIRLQIYPDGGVSRLRLYGEPL